MAFLSIDRVTKSFGSVQVLQEFSASVAEGELLVLVGPSGCGKSTLLNMIAGLEEVTTGEISIRGKVINGLHPSRRNIAMVFQSYALYPNMTVAQNITFGLEMHGVPKPVREDALENVSKLLQIEQLLKRRPGQLSGGQRQRVAMGRALVREPDVFLFDEPLSNLDAKLRVDMRTEIKKLHQKLGTTMIYVTHDQIEAMTLSTRIAVMDQGLLHQIGTPREIYDMPADLFVAGFMGSPPMNLVEVDIVKSGAEAAVEISSGGETGRLALSQRVSDLSGIGERAVLGIRPESITDPESADRNAKNIQRFSSEVSVIEPAGSDTFVTTQICGLDCVARLRADAELQTGQRYEFAFNMDKAVLFDSATGQRIG